MANFTTEDDKRIRDLQLKENPLLNDFIAMDRAGDFSASRITIQQIVDMAASATPSAKVYSDNINPDDAFGNNGDMFFTLPADGSALKLFQKSANVWGLIFNLPLGTKIQEWQENIPTNTSVPRTHQIDSITYLFISKIDGNLSEPSLSDGAWTPTDIFNAIEIWDDGFTYPAGQYVTGDGNSKVYLSKDIAGNNNHQPTGGISDAYWQYIGAYRGFYDSTFPYDAGDVIVNGHGDGRIYISNVADNLNPLTDTGSDWELIGMSPDDVQGMIDSSTSTLKKTLSYNEADINTDGDLIIRPADTASLSGKDLLSAYVNDDPVGGTLFYKTTSKLSNFGNYIGLTDLNIKLTFI